MTDSGCSEQTEIATSAVLGRLEEIFTIDDLENTKCGQYYSRWLIETDFISRTR